MTEGLIIDVLTIVLVFFLCVLFHYNNQIQYTLGHMRGLLDGAKAWQEVKKREADYKQWMSNGHKDSELPVWARTEEWYSRHPQARDAGEEEK